MKQSEHDREVKIDAALAAKLAATLANCPHGGTLLVDNGAVVGFSESRPPTRGDEIAAQYFMSVARADGSEQNTPSLARIIDAERADAEVRAERKALDGLLSILAGLKISTPERGYRDLQEAAGDIGRAVRETFDRGLLNGEDIERRRCLRWVDCFVRGAMSPAGSTSYRSLTACIESGDECRLGTRSCRCDPTACDRKTGGTCADCPLK